jgi:hypothetical protein
MNIGIIDIEWADINSLNPLGGALGGSETWLIQISREFAKENNVDLYCKCNIRYRKDHNVNIYNSYNIKQQLSNMHYDFIILNRFLYKDGINWPKYIKEHNIADHIYVQLHDLSIVQTAEYCDIFDANHDFNDELINSGFVTIVTLNEFHKENTLLQYPTILSQNIICIPNGVDLSLFSDVIKEKDNRILWSSCPERGLDILVNDIYPIVKRKIPDFGIDIASYNEYDDNIDISGKDINYIGRLSKSDLYAEQSKHKVWFYPATFAETFCITMLENILNGCKVVSPLRYGMEATLGSYADNIKMQNNFEDNYTDAVQEASNKIIDILRTDSSESVYSEICNKIQTEYNWTYSANAYIENFKNIKQNVKKHYKGIFLALSCNIPFFKESLKAVQNTWAKDIIEGYYQDYTFYGYASCNDEHPIECIDEENHMIYINCLDDIYHTYTKTKKAYILLREQYDFDFIIRTNTSVYVNRYETIKYINNINENDICGPIRGFYLETAEPENFLFNICCGLFLISSTNILDRVFYSQYSETDIFNEYNMKASDDSIISYIIKKLGLNVNLIDIPCGKYKVPCNIAQDFALINVSDIHNTLYVQVRTNYNENDNNYYDRITKGHETEHLYELDAWYNEYYKK